MATWTSGSRHTHAERPLEGGSASSQARPGCERRQERGLNPGLAATSEAAALTSPALGSVWRGVNRTRRRVGSPSTKHTTCSPGFKTPFERTCCRCDFLLRSCLEAPLRFKIWNLGLPQPGSCAHCNSGSEALARDRSPEPARHPGFPRTWPLEAVLREPFRVFSSPRSWGKLENR